MKKISIILLTVICGLCMASCSSEDEPKTEIDQELFATLEKGGTSIFYKRVKCDLKERKNSSSKWENCKDYPIGLEGAIDWLYIDKGQIFAPLKLFSSCNSLLIDLNMVNAAYIKATKSNRKYFLASSLTSNTEKTETKIDGKQYKIRKFDTSSLILDEMPDANANYKFIIHFEARSIPQSALDGVVTVQREKDAYYDIIDTAKEYFGDTIDLSKIYDPHFVIYDDPIIDLNAIEEELDARYGR